MWLLKHSVLVFENLKSVCNKFSYSEKATKIWKNSIKLLCPIHYNFGLFGFGKSDKNAIFKLRAFISMCSVYFLFLFQIQFLFLFQKNIEDCTFLALTKKRKDQSCNELDFSKFKKVGKIFSNSCGILKTSEL